MIDIKWSYVNYMNIQNILNKMKTWIENPNPINQNQRII